MISFDSERDRMVETQIEGRGVKDPRVLEAMRDVPRERFVPENLAEFAYEDAPLPIDEGQTISQPYIVALMIESIELTKDDRVLEIGAGSGYAAAVMGRIAREVYAIERHEALARRASQRMERLGYENVHVASGDGTRGWADHAPYDAIIVSAGGRKIPDALREQLAIGGRMVIPIGDEPRSQELLLIRRSGEHAFDEESLGRVQFVPLVGTEGWRADGTPIAPHRAPEPLRVREPDLSDLSSLIRESCAKFGSIEEAPMGALLDRIGDARVVLIGEASHGTSEFYRMRDRITRELIERKGFDAVTIEGDWPDTSTIDRYVRGREGGNLRTSAFSRFPTWMWRNRETREFIEWLAEFNAPLDPERRVSMHGLDLYSLNNSIGAVLEYLDRVDSEAAEDARTRYGCFSPWEMDPATYGRAAVSGRMDTCEEEAVSILTDLMKSRMDYIEHDGDAFFDAQRNATVVREAERYYRTMYYGARESWNLRDQHMFDTLKAVMDHRGEDSRVVVWAHNSHVGNAVATEMGTRGELNIGQLAREHFGSKCYSIGFGTDHGTVAAASNWGEPMQTMRVRPSHEDSYERLFHESGVGACFLHLRDPMIAAVRQELLKPHLERAIGVIYRPETELLSHYFQAALPAQFDEYVWFDETRAVTPIETRELQGVPETYPFGL